jgi:hypothetical protein
VVAGRGTGRLRRASLQMEVTAWNQGDATRRPHRPTDSSGTVVYQSKWNINILPCHYINLSCVKEVARGKWSHPNLDMPATWRGRLL